MLARLTDLVCVADITALEARAEIERRMQVKPAKLTSITTSYVQSTDLVRTHGPAGALAQNGLAQFERGFYAIPPMKIVAPPVPQDLAEQDKIRLSDAAAVRRRPLPISMFCAWSYLTVS
jgi:hypothetical protein